MSPAVRDTQIKTRSHFDPLGWPKSTTSATLGAGGTRSKAFSWPGGHTRARLLWRQLGGFLQKHTPASRSSSRCPWYRPERTDARPHGARTQVFAELYPEQPKFAKRQDLPQHVVEKHTGPSDWDTCQQQKETSYRRRRDVEEPSRHRGEKPVQTAAGHVGPPVRTFWQGQGHGDGRGLGGGRR